MIFDTHCHAYWSDLAPRSDEVHRNMLAQGVTRSVQIGTDLGTTRDALTLALSWGADTWCTAGLHPTECQDLPGDSAPAVMAEFRELIKANQGKIVAVGETGLDYYHVTRGCEAEQIQTQKTFFRAQAALADESGLPLIIHTRDAAEDILSEIRERGVRRAVIHCFSENPGFARELLSWSDEVYFSFSGILTYKKALSVQETARVLPLERILVETDAPFLVPQVMRDRYSVNEPAFTRYVLEFLKTLRREPGDLVEETVWRNSHAFYGINPQGFL